MGKVSIDFDTGIVSDGYHTFDELYDHRYTLFVALMRSNPHISWRSLKHSDGSMLEDCFIAGMCLPTGDITYHLPIHMWGMLENAGIWTYDTAPNWDGHNSSDVIDRLAKWVSLQIKSKENDKIA